ncbi:hypothetical protein T11_7012 [Trichinella zimbabwensis]|uniref:Uncharacterized protein n=1 Tax=Trichinella zimbabwensis TaxID=268475 RepID=A0A0V1H5B8_9BILA|nr:hypothetical protein T11_7012 [Trichinella zimbabwensis]
MGNLSLGFQDLISDRYKSIPVIFGEKSLPREFPNFVSYTLPCFAKNIFQNLDFFDYQTLKLKSESVLESFTPN